MNGDKAIMNIVMIVSEVGLLVGVFTLMNLLIGGMFKQIAGIRLFRGGSERLESLRRYVRGLLILTCAGLCLLLLGVNGYWIYQGEELLSAGRTWTRRVPEGFWVELGWGLVKTILFVAVAGVAGRYLRRLMNVLELRVKRMEQLKADHARVESFFRSLGRLLTNTIWIIVLMASAVVLGLPGGIPVYLGILLKIYLIISMAMLLVLGMETLIDSLDALSGKYSSPENLLRFYGRLRHLVPLLKRSLEYILYVYAATLVALQVKLISSLAAYGPRLVRIIGIVFLSRVVIEVVNLAIEEGMVRAKAASAAQQQRRMTLVPLFQSAMKYVIYFGAGIMILIEIGINPMPILAGAGIMGLAVGLGAQNLVNDVVSGFFILFENHYLVGDFIETGGARGMVEAIDLRTTRVRNPDGQLHILRNGQIGEILNYSKEYTHAVVEVGVAYESDLNHVYEVLERTGRDLRENDPDVLEPTEVRGLQKFGESELLIRTVTKVRAGRHLRIQQKLRKMIKEAFDREGIEIPFARRVLILRDEQGVDRLANILERSAGSTQQPDALG